MANGKPHLPPYLGDTLSEKQEYHHHQPLPLRLPLSSISQLIPPPLKSGRLKIDTHLAAMPVASLDDFSSPPHRSPWSSLPLSQWDVSTLAKQITAFILSLTLLLSAYPFESGFLPLILGWELSPAIKAIDWFLFNAALFYASYCLFSLASLFESDTLLITLPFWGCLGPRRSRTIIGGQIVTEARKKWWAWWKWTWHPRYFWYLAVVKVVFLTAAGIASHRGDIFLLRKWAVTGALSLTGYIGWGAARVMTVRWWTWY